MRTTISFVAISGLCLLSACSTIVQGSTDHINVSTAPAYNANCTLKNSRETVNATTPGAVAIQKSISDIDVNCNDAKTGASGKTKLASDVEPWDFGNILLGGIIGMSVDWITGAAYNYPDNLVVPMSLPTSAR